MLDEPSIRAHVCAVLLVCHFVGEHPTIHEDVTVLTTYGLGGRSQDVDGNDGRGLASLDVRDLPQFLHDVQTPDLRELAAAEDPEYVDPEGLGPLNGVDRFSFLP